MLEECDDRSHDQGRASFAECMLTLPRHRRDNSATGAGKHCLRIVGLEGLVDERADRLQHSELRCRGDRPRAHAVPGLPASDDQLRRPLPTSRAPSGARRGVGRRVRRFPAGQHRADLIFDICDRVAVAKSRPRSLPAGRPSGSPRAPGGGRCLPGRSCPYYDVAGLRTGYGRIGRPPRSRYPSRRARSSRFLAPTAPRRRCCSRGLRAATATAGAMAHSTGEACAALTPRDGARRLASDRGPPHLHATFASPTISCFQPTIFHAASAWRGWRKYSACFPKSPPNGVTVERAQRRTAADARRRAGLYANRAS